MPCDDSYSSDSDARSAEDKSYDDDFEEGYTPDSSPAVAAAKRDNSKTESKEDCDVTKSEPLTSYPTPTLTSTSSSSSASSSWKHIDFETELELLDQIGGGGVGLVYNGIYSTPALGNLRVALKTLFDPKVDAELHQEFMDELQVMARCEHPNVVSFYGACLTPPNLCFVMELCTCSLFDVLHSNKTDHFSLYARINMCLQVARGLSYLHNTLSPPLIHRDIKSHNILVSGDVDNDPVLKLCDFGLVKTRNTTAGTPNYMAPELFESKPFSASVDVYAFAIVMWEIFTQELPFRGYDPSDIARVVVEGERPEIPTIDVPVECQEIMRNGWSPDASDRPDFKFITRTLERVLERTPMRSALDELGDDDALFDM
jgi:serine/threonine protein kinase